MIQNQRHLALWSNCIIQLLKQTSFQSINQVLVCWYHLLHKRRGINKSVKTHIRKICRLYTCTSCSLSFGYPINNMQTTAISTNMHNPEEQRALKRVLETKFRLSLGERMKLCARARSERLEVGFSITEMSQDMGLTLSYWLKQVEISFFRLGLFLK